MPRRRPPLEFTDSNERWLVSYADFLTLLFAFFVVMYSTSAVTNGDFRVLSNSIVQAFGMPGRSFTSDESNGINESAANPVLTPMKSAGNDFEAVVQLAQSSEVLRRQQQMSAVQALLSADLEAEAPAGVIAVISDSEFVDIEIPAGLLFPSGARTLLADSMPIISRIAATLRDLPNEIVVQGHTDNRLIRNGRFPSNWELSSSRAAALVRIFEAAGIDSTRMSAQGYAASRPVASNDSQEGRELNRRVVIRVRSQRLDAARLTGGSGNTGESGDG
ncbi:MAG: flagellar motor protein MotB [Congregibacter sp.]